MFLELVFRIFENMVQILHKKNANRGFVLVFTKIDTKIQRWATQVT